MVALDPSGRDGPGRVGFDGRGRRRPGIIALCAIAAVAAALTWWSKGARVSPRDEGPAAEARVEVPSLASAPAPPDILSSNPVAPRTPSSNALPASRPTAALRVEVTAHDSGLPVAGAVCALTVASESGSSSGLVLATPSIARAETGADGSASLALPNSNAGNRWVHVRAPGFQPASVAAGTDETRLLVSLARGQSIAGDVRGPAGHPIAGSWVEARPIDGPVDEGRRLLDLTPRAPLKAVVLADGRFALDGLRTVRYALTAFADGWMAPPAGGRGQVVAEPGSAEVHLRLVPVRILRVRFMDATTGAAVRAPPLALRLRPGREEDAERFGFDAKERLSVAGRESVLGDIPCEDGAVLGVVRFRGEPPSDERMVIGYEPAGFARGRSSVRVRLPTEAMSDTSVDIVDLTPLHPSPGGRGVVTLEEDTLAEDLFRDGRRFLWPEAPGKWIPILGVRTGPTAWTFPDVPEGSWTLRVTDGLGAVTTPSETVVVRRAEPASLRFSHSAVPGLALDLRDPSGAPLYDADDVLIQQVGGRSLPAPADSELTRLYVDENGRARRPFRALDPGVYKVSAFKSGFGWKTADATVGVGEIVTLRLVLDDPASEKREPR